MLVVWTLWKREIVRFFRERSRVIGAIAPPLIFWLILGTGIGRYDFAPGAPKGLTYLQYFYPGTVLLVVLFTAIFATISIVEDRREGFMQSVLVAPVSRSAVVTGKILGATTLGMIQGLLFLPLAGLAGLSITLPDFAYIMLILFLAAFGLTGLGFILAWRLNSTQGFHSVMNLFIIPMWMLSGALFSVESVPGWMRMIARVNPMFYSVTAMQDGFGVAGSGAVAASTPPFLCVTVLSVFAVLTFAVSVFEARRGSA